jgi:UDP-3-O-[3-hydroxymyristoyl] glucosamine N-acyltransferase
VTVGELIEKLGGELLRGRPETVISGVADVAAAGHLQLVFGESEAVGATAIQSAAGAAVVAAGLTLPGDCRMAVVAAPQPRLWFAQAARLLAKPRSEDGIHDSATVALDAVLGRHTSVGAGAVIDSQTDIGDHTAIDAGAVIGLGVRIGKDCHIYPRAVIYPKTMLGDRVVVHAGSVLGADGFGYVRDKQTGVYTQFPQQGRLVIEDDVEIGANTTIDRGALGETRIRRGTKIDNLVHIGHNCDIGADVVIAAQTGISGSSTVGKGAVIAGQVGIGDHAHVGPGVILGGQAGVLSGKTVDTTGTVLWGTPAKPLREYLRELATLTRLAKRKKD